jgi:hypothetical protein
MQSMCASDVLLERLGRIAHTDHVNHYWWSRGVGLIGYHDFFNDIRMDSFRFTGQDEWY